MSQVETERTSADEKVPKPVHPYRSVRLDILSLNLRALAEVLRDVRSEFLLARGWIHSHLDDLKRDEFDLQWKELVVNPMEIRWRRALAEIRKTLDYAGRVASDLPTGLRVLAALVRIEQELNSFTPGQLSWEVLSDQRLIAERRLERRAKRLEMMASAVRRFYVPPKARIALPKAEEMVSKWIERHGFASSRDIGRELGCSHVQVQKCKSWQEARRKAARARPKIDEAVDPDKLAVADDQLTDLKFQECWEDIVSKATPDERQQLEAKTPLQRRELVECVIKQLHDDRDDNRPSYAERRVPV